MPTHEEFRTVQREARVHLLSVGARDAYLEESTAQALAESSRARQQ